MSAPDAVEQLKALRSDVMIAAAYGQILRQSVLDLPPLGVLNIHPSLLPRYRGASPVAAAILAGDEETGVTVMRIVLALDDRTMTGRAALSPSTRSDRMAFVPASSMCGRESHCVDLDGLRFYSMSINIGRRDALSSQGLYLFPSCRTLGDGRLNWIHTMLLN